MPALHVLRVFVNEDGEWGNPLGIFLDGERVPAPERQRTAAELGFSETVFVEDRDRSQIRIYTPTVELPFAGHPSVGAAWLLAREDAPVETLRLPAGEVSVRYDDDVTYISRPARVGAALRVHPARGPAQARALRHAPGGAGNTYAWAWIDEAAGTIRSRSFVPEAGIGEDEATGSAALALCAQLGRSIAVHQGRGSVLLCRPIADGWAEVGGRVALDQVRPAQPVPAQGTR